MDWDSTIKGFIAYLTLEKGLSGHSIEAYTRDVRRIALFMVKDLGVNSPTAVTSHQIEQFLHVLNEVEISHRTQARMLSGIRAFYQYLILEDMLAADPTEHRPQPPARCAQCGDHRDAICLWPACIGTHRIAHQQYLSRHANHPCHRQE